MNINGYGGMTVGYGTMTRPLGAGGGASGSTSATKEATTDFASLFKELKKEAAKTPEERAREKVLEKNDLDEESYQRLPKDERAAIDAQIRDAVKRVAEQRRDNALTERMA